MITYFNILLFFIIPPLIVLGILTKIRISKIRVNSLDSKPVLFLLSVIAFVYTTPWDNYLVANKIWFYDELLISGIVFYWVPLEEYLFFILETLLVGLLFLNINTMNTKKHLNSDYQSLEYKSIRLQASFAVIIIWIISLVLFILGPPEFTYLSLILLWAIIPISIQFAFGADIIWENINSVSLAIGISTLYLSLIDAYAINSGTWTIDPNYSLSQFKIGIMPLEEILFFFITTTLVTFGMLLGTNYKSQLRLLQIIEKFKTKNHKIPRTAF